MGAGEGGGQNLATFQDRVGTNFGKLVKDGKIYITADTIDVRPPMAWVGASDWPLADWAGTGLKVVGNKAYVEGRGEGETFKAGTYKNKQATLCPVHEPPGTWLTIQFVARIMLVIEFSPESGKIIKFSEYLDTALAWQAKDAHGVY